MQEERNRKQEGSEEGRVAARIIIVTSGGWNQEAAAELADRRKAAWLTDERCDLIGQLRGRRGIRTITCGFI